MQQQHILCQASVNYVTFQQTPSDSKLVFVKYTMCPQKNVPFYFLNNSVKNLPILTISGLQNPEETCD